MFTYVNIFLYDVYKLILCTDAHIIYVVIRGVWIKCFGISGERDINDHLLEKSAVTLGRGKKDRLGGLRLQPGIIERTSLEVKLKRSLRLEDERL